MRFRHMYLGQTSKVNTKLISRTTCQNYVRFFIEIKAFFRTFFRFPVGKKVCILKGEMPFKMHKKSFFFLFFSRKKKKICVYPTQNFQTRYLSTLCDKYQNLAKSLQCTWYTDYLYNTFIHMVQIIKKKKKR